MALAFLVLIVHEQMVTFGYSQPVGEADESPESRGESFDLSYKN